MSACGKPPNTEALSTAPLVSAAMAWSMMSFMGWREGACTSVLVIIGREPQTITGCTSPSRARRRVRPGSLARLPHVHVGVGAVAGHHRGVLDHGRGHVRVEVEAHRDGQARGDRADPAQELALAVVEVLGDHGPVKREEGRVAAAADRAHDGVRHVLVGALLHVPGGMRSRRDGHHDLRARLARHLEEAAELGVRVLELGDGGLAGEGPERRERRRHRREGVRLVHHHRDDDLPAGHAVSSRGRV